MNYLKRYIFLTVAAAGLFTACNKDNLKNLNVDPQSASTIDVNFLFTSAELGAASGGSAGDNRYIDWRTNIGMASTAIQQLATAGGDISSAGDKYLDNTETSSAPWEFIYSDQLKNIGIILKQTGTGGFAEGQNNNTRQAARILRAFLFHRLTDYYGSIPYFESMQANEGIFFPKYDKQKDIYADLLKELDEATAAFTTDADPDFAAADLYYNGDVAKWKRWGYSLMLRLAMRVSNVQVDESNTYVAKAVAGGVFQSNADNTIVPMDVGPSLWTNQNGISRAFIPGDGGNASFLSKTLVDFLKGSNAGSTADDDPRLMILSGGIGIWQAGEPPVWKPVSENPLDQKGMPNGKDINMLKTIEGDANLNPDSTYSKINPKLLDRDEPYMLMNYAEVELLQAEASERSIGGLSPAGAAAHYMAGVKAAMQMYKIYDPSFVVTDAQVNTYLAAHPYGVEKPALEMIGDQLWVSLFMNWWEAWAEWRRTNYPVLVPTNYPGNVTGGKIPQRLRYPAAEVGGNPNFATGATAPNDYVTKVWWAGGPE